MLRMASLTPFLIRTGGDGMRGGAQIEVDSEDVTDKVAAYRLVQVEGEPAALAIELKPGGTIEGDAIVSAVAPAGALIDWLDKVDPDRLESKALDLGQSEGLGVGQSFIAVLKRLAAEQDSPPREPSPVTDGA